MLLARKRRPLRPGHRNDFSTGFQQALSKYLQVDANYFWKFTQNAFDFDTLFNSPITFPISWKQSKIDGVSARFLDAESARGSGVHDARPHAREVLRARNRRADLQFEREQFECSASTTIRRLSNILCALSMEKDGPWAAFTWRYDSGEVAGAVNTLDDALALDGDQQAAIGFFCGAQRATLYSPITSCGRQTTAPSD